MNIGRGDRVYAETATTAVEAAQLETRARNQARGRCWESTSSTGEPRRAISLTGFLCLPCTHVLTTFGYIGFEGSNRIFDTKSFHVVRSKTSSVAILGGAGTDQIYHG